MIVTTFRFPRRRRPALASVAALALAGCGSSQLSAAQLRSDATRACSVAASKTSKIPTPSTPGEGAAFLRQGIAVLEPELAALRSLKPPSDQASLYETAARTFSRQLEALERTAESLSAGADPVSAIEGLERRLSPLEARSDRIWQTLGIPACVSR